MEVEKTTCEKKFFYNLKNSCDVEVKHCEELIRYHMQWDAGAPKVKMLRENIRLCEELLEILNTFIEYSKDKEEIEIDKFSLKSLLDRSQEFLKYKDAMCEYGVSTEAH